MTVTTTEVWHLMWNHVDGLRSACGEEGPTTLSPEKSNCAECLRVHKRENDADRNNDDQR